MNAVVDDLACEAAEMTAQVFAKAGSVSAVQLQGLANSGIQVRLRAQMSFVVVGFVAMFS